MIHLGMIGWVVEASTFRSISVLCFFFTLSHIPTICLGEWHRVRLHERRKTILKNKIKICLVIHRVRFFLKNLQKSTFSNQLGLKLTKIIKFWWVNWVSSYLSFFHERLHWCYIYFHCSYLYNYYNYSQTLCIKCWVSAFGTQLLLLPAFHTEI